MAMLDMRPMGDSPRLGRRVVQALEVAARPRRHLRVVRVESRPVEEPLPPFPRTRADCPDERPCPFVSCRHHLALNVTTDGRVSWNVPGLGGGEWLLRTRAEEAGELLASGLLAMGETCTLDVVESRGRLTLEATGELLGITKEATRQCEESGLAALGPLMRDYR